MPITVLLREPHGDGCAGLFGHEVCAPAHRL